MGWRAFVHPTLPIIETHYEDAMSPEELLAAAEESIRLSLEHGRTLFFADCTRLRQGPSTSHIYELFGAIERSNVARGAREAMLLPDELPPGSDVAENLRFFEDLAVNRGFHVRVFADRQAAMDWLVPREGMPK